MESSSKKENIWWQIICREQWSLEDTEGGLAEKSASGSEGEYAGNGFQMHWKN